MSQARSRALPVVSSEPSPSVQSLPQNTYLPHWGPFKRAVHWLCKHSRNWNTVVAAAEMRLGREELLSLPQYMALCPTGQCNALCDFCSVTKARSGIIKKQLGFDRVTRFIRPVARTIRMYGLEGNGEPSLYDHFDELVDLLTANGATFYLITNGERLKPDQIDRMRARGACGVNFSLNAATPETHRKVMKLKHFETVTANIRRFTQQRTADWPEVSVSFVVTRDNVHEVQEFLRFAEYHLEVDRILVRPLSELGGDAGVVEDLRSLVPYESEIKDMLDSVREYVTAVPRRADIIIDPGNFRSFRADPPEQILRPPGFENCLLAPRRDGWVAPTAGVSVQWLLNQLSVSRRSAGSTGELLKSQPIPVEPGKTLSFKCEATVAAGRLSVAVTDEAGQCLAAKTLEAGIEVQSIALAFNPTDQQAVRVVLSSPDSTVGVTVSFPRLWTPAASVSRTFKLPHPRRWEIESPGVRVAWSGSRVDLAWQGAPYLYLLKSFTIPCVPGRRYSLPIDVQVTSGTLAIGILGSGGQKWAKVMPFAQSVHGTELLIDTGDNQELQVVLFSNSPVPLQASVDWRGHLDELPRHQAVTLAPEQLRRQVSPDGKPMRPVLSNALAQLVLPTGQPNSTLDRAAPKPVPRRRSAGWFLALPVKALGSLVLFAGLVVLLPLLLWRRRKPEQKTQYYCQKPWTDLNNFTVDGRMDVCCIATGASQEKYALGNILTQRFQDIWNGPMMREFRRTVNGTKPLPPCQRCPMAFSYQGPLFSPTETRALLHGRAGRLRLAPLVRLARWLADMFMDRLLFRGFHK